MLSPTTVNGPACGNNTPIFNGVAAGLLTTAGAAAAALAGAAAAGLLVAAGLGALAVGWHAASSEPPATVLAVAATARRNARRSKFEGGSFIGVSSAALA